MIDGPPVRHIRPLAVALLAGWLGACATPPATSHLLSQTDGVPSRAEVLDVPFHPQEDHYCGPAALAMMLGWSGKAVTTEELISQVYTPGREGTLHADILTAARRHGRLAVPVRSLGDILVELAAGHPVLVFENLGLEWYPQWHYAVAVAYDLSREQITLRSGDEARHTIALSTFERVWDRGRRWAVVVLPPDRLPARADPMVVLDAAAGIERLGDTQAAATAYKTTLGQWPYLLAGWVGLGNAYHKLGDDKAAEDAFRRATDVAPGSPIAWNNLAHILAERGALASALEAARRAVALAQTAADDNMDAYRQTLMDISARIGEAAAIKNDLS